MTNASAWQARPTAATPGFRRPAIGIFCVALAVRAVHLWQMRGTPFFSVLMGDSRGYDEWARRLAGGDWIGTEVFYQAPLYPYFLGAIYAIAGHDLMIVRAIQAILGALSSAALAYAGWRLFSRRVGLAAGLALAFYPAAIFFDALIQKSVLDLFFTCVALALIGAVIAGTRREGLVWFLLGVTLAALSLTREQALLLVIVVAVWAVIRGTKVPRYGNENVARDFSPAIPLLFLLGVAVLLLPVAIRNSAVGGGFYLTTSQFGSNFFIGNNPASDGTYMSLRPGRGAPEFERLDATELAQEAVGRTLTPGEVSDYWFARSRAYIRAEPAAWLRLMARKIALLVNTSEMLDTESQESHVERSTLLSITSLIGRYGVLVPLALFGAVVAWPRRSELWIVYALLVTYALSVVVFFVMARYRHPLLPFLLLFAAAGVVGAPRWLRTASPRRVAAVAVVLLLAMVAANRDMLSAPLMQAISEHNLATALQEEGRLDEAVRHYERAIALRPDYAPAFNNLGTARMAQGDLAAAVAAFRESLRLQPGSRDARELLAKAEYDRGSTLLEGGSLNQAEAVLRESLRLNPESAEAHNNLGITLAQLGRLEEAVQHWRRALVIKPGFLDAERNLKLAER